MAESDFYNSDSSDNSDNSDNSELEEFFKEEDDDEETIFEVLRRKVLCINAHNQILSKRRVHLEDAVNLAYILVQIGTFDLHSDPEDFQDCNCFEVDKVTKKITQLFISNDYRTFAAPWRVPIDIISSLDMLEVLMLSNINVSSPNAVEANKTTTLSQKRRSLCNLKRLDISYSKMVNDGVLLETRFFDLLPNLESISFRLNTGRRETAYIHTVLDDLRNCCAFQNTLKRIDLRRTMCTQDQLEALLVEVAPKLPNLTHIDISHNKIQSLQRIADMINKQRGISNGRCQSQNNLRCLDLSWNTVTLKLKNDKKEKAALMTILRTFKGLYDLGNDVNLEEHPPDVRYQLIMNHAGRKIVEACYRCHKPISVKILPLLLERAFEKSQDIFPTYFRDEKKKDPTGIYYLFQSGPILQAFIQHRIADNGEKNENGGAKPEIRTKKGCNPMGHKRRKTSI